MSTALSTGVTGLQAHQKMLDVAGNNLANVNTTAFKAGRITFSELLSETIKKASQPTTNTGGTNPQQMGSGVGVSGIAPLMSQGNIVKTGNPLDVAIEGEGYLVLSDGSQNLYTRAGAFGVDANSYLVDPATGYRVQRIGEEGQPDFQTEGNSNIRVPYDAALPAQATSSITVQGNLSADAVLATAQTNVLKSDIAFTAINGTAAVATTKLDELSQFTANGGTAAGTITFSGYDSAGNAFGSALATAPAVALTMSVSPTTTMADILNKLNGTTNGVATSEVQTLAATGTSPTGGTFTLTVGGQTTTALEHDSTVLEIEAALNALSTVGTDEIDVVGTLDAGNVTFTFPNDAGDVGMISCDGSLLTGDGGFTGVGVTETTKGIAAEGSGILGTDAVATLDSNGKIVITDASSGYSKADINLAYTAAGDETLTMPGYFEYSTVGGTEVQNINITIYDSQGGSHVISGAIVRTDTDNTWDMLLSSVTGSVSALGYDNRRIEGIEFNASDGSYSGLNSTTDDTAEFAITFAHDTANPQTIAVDLGTANKFNGLTQFATGVSGTSTAVARGQNGYAAGSLSNVSINNEGILIGSFSNGVKKNIATLQIALFQNAAGLESLTGGYLTSSANSGEAVATQGLASGAGAIHGGSLEKSNADVATEFVNMIQAQNGFQANARTIKVANDILRELTSLIR